MNINLQLSTSKLNFKHFVLYSLLLTLMNNSKIFVADLEWKPKNFLLELYFYLTRFAQLHNMIYKTLKGSLAAILLASVDFRPSH